MAGTQRALIVLWAAIALALTGCSQLPVSQQYLSQTTYGLYLTVPPSYVLLEGSDSATTNPDAPASYVRAFHGPATNPDTLLSGPDLGGYMGMRVVPGDLAAAEKAAANSAISDLEKAISDGTAQVVSGPTILEKNDSFVTVEWTIKARIDSSGAESTLLQRATIGILPANPLGQPEAHVVKSLVLGCSADCYARSTDTILAITDSWRFN